VQNQHLKYGNDYSSPGRERYVGQHYPNWLNYDQWMYLVAIAGGWVIGKVYLAKGQELKWVLVLLIAMLFPVVVAMVRSLRTPLFVVLIFSLCTQMEWNPWYSNAYGEVNPGFALTLTVMMLVLLIAMWLFDVYRGLDKMEFFPLTTIPFFLMTAWAGASAIVAEHPIQVQAAFPFALTAFLVYFYLANALRTSADYKLLIFAVAFTMGVSGLVGTLQSLKGAPLGLGALGELDQITIHHGQARIAGLMGHPNGYGQFMAAFLPVLLLCILSFAELGKMLRLICLGGFGIGMIALLLSLSRGAWLGFVIAVMIMMAGSISWRYRQHTRGFIRGMVILGLIGLLAVSPLIPSMVRRLSGDDGDSAYSRIPLALMALRVIGDHPITGVGLGNYKYAVDRYKPSKDYYLKATGLPFAVHNMTLYITAELGIPVFVLYAWCVFAFLGIGFAAAWNPDKYKSLVGVGMVGGLFSVWLSSQFEDVPLGDPRFVVFSAMAGIIVSTQRKPAA